MSRKDYCKFADAYNELLRAHVSTTAEGTGNFMAGDMFDAMVKATADIFSSDNYRFDRERFMKAVYNFEG